jgi:hypothetical protein
MNKRTPRLDVTLLLAGLLAAPGYGLAQSYQATPLEPDTSYSLRTKGVSRRGMTSVLVKLDADALASPRVTGARTLDLDAPSSRAYLEHFRRKQEGFEAACRASVPGAVVTHSLPLIFGGVAVVLPEDAVEELARLPGVQQVYPDELLKIDTDASPRFIGAPAVWSALGGRENAAQGIVVGVLDTGIWPEHPSFADPDPPARPIRRHPPPGLGARVS